MNEKITIEDIVDLAEFSSAVRVVNARTGRTIIDGLGALKNSKDKRQIAKWEAYRDVPISHMRAFFLIGDTFREVAHAAIEVSIWDSDDKAARERVKEILKGDSDAKP